MKKIKILLVCSESELKFLLCLWIAEFLRESGRLYQMRIVSSCDEAEQRVENGESFDLVISDQTLSDGKGATLLDMLEALHRAIGEDIPRRILMSGHPSVETLNDPTILQKPFTKDGFKTMLEQRLTPTDPVAAA